MIRFFGGEAQKIHIAFPDPAAASGTEEDRLVAFRKVRDQIRMQIVEFLSKQGE